MNRAVDNTRNKPQCGKNVNDNVIRDENSAFYSAFLKHLNDDLLSKC